jgi:transposase-like protein
VAEPAPRRGAVYPVIFIDCIHVKIRDRQVANRPIYVALAVTADGGRDILGLWAGDGGEGAKWWLGVLTEIRNRGAGDVCMVVCDGLKGRVGRVRRLLREVGTQGPGDRAVVDQRVGEMVPFLGRDTFSLTSAAIVSAT